MVTKVEEGNQVVVEGQIIEKSMIKKIYLALLKYAFK